MKRVLFGLTWTVISPAMFSLDMAEGTVRLAYDSQEWYLYDLSAPLKGKYFKRRDDAARWVAIQLQKLEKEMNQ